MEIMFSLGLLWMISLFGAIPGIFLCLLLWADLMRNGSTLNLLGFPVDCLFYRNWTARLRRNHSMNKTAKLSVGALLFIGNALMWFSLSFCGVLFSAYLLGRFFLLYLMDNVGININMIIED